MWTSLEAPVIKTTHRQKMNAMTSIIKLLAAERDQQINSGRVGNCLSVAHQAEKPCRQASLRR